MPSPVLDHQGAREGTKALTGPTPRGLDPLDALRTQPAEEGSDNLETRNLRKCLAKGLSAPFGGCPVMTKLSLAWAVLALVWGALTTFDSWVIRIGLIAGALVTLGTVWEKFVKPTAQKLRRAGEAFDAILVMAKDKKETDEWRQSVNDSLAELKQARESELTVTHKVQRDD